VTALILAALLCLTNAAHAAAPKPTNYDDLTGHAGECDGQP
jgi:Spy/CpxP family protein refolding chaperone